jgi:putative membrane protein
MQVPMIENVFPPDPHQLALDRTWLAHERTLMAWVRTAASMISFGFTIYKFFQFEVDKGAPIRHGVLSPRSFALIMVSIGLVSLLTATVSHRNEVRRMRAVLQGKHSLAELIAWFVSIFGLLVLVAAIFRD